MKTCLSMLFVVLAVVWPAQAMEFQLIGDAGNAVDSRTVENGHWGAVGYEYAMGTYEVTNAQYSAFLNAVAKSDPYALYSLDMGDSSYAARGGIARTGSDGSYTYSTVSGRENMPVLNVSWRSAARFANWMHNGMQANAATTEYGAYDASSFVGDGWNHQDKSHNANAKYWLPTRDEWYKAAFYKGGSTNAGYWTYATQTDSRPLAGPFTSYYHRVNYEADNFFPYINQQGDVVPVDFYDQVVDSVDPYGTFQMGGNAAEWVENWWPGLEGYYKPYMGGAWKANGEGEVSIWGIHLNVPEASSNLVGFRLAADPRVVPEPASMLLLGAGAIAFYRKRK